jgi:hypothetical protein
MSNIVKIVQALQNVFPLKAATNIEITDAEIELRVSFANEYKEYLTSFGAIIADGIELTGIAKADYRNVVKVTQQEWELNGNVPHSMYVVESTGIDGIIIWQDTKGIIYQSSPNVPPKEIAKSLSEYILKRNQ